MVSRLTSAMEEAYASAPANVVLFHTLELYHATFGGPVLILTGEEGVEPASTISLFAEATAWRPAMWCDFTALAFDVTPPGYDDDGPTPAKVRIDGVSDLLFPFIEAAAGAANTISVIYRTYRSDVRFEPGDVIAGLKMRQVVVTATSVEGALSFDEVGEQAFPRVTYNLDDYPGLFTR